MRKLLALTALSLLIVLGPTSALAASPSPSPSPSAAPAAATLSWVATIAKSGSLSGSSRVTVTTTYSHGTFWVHANGVKNGDVVTARLMIKSKSSTRTIVVASHKVVGTSGKVSFAVGLGATSRSAIKAAVKAGSTLVVRLTDGKSSSTGTYKKA